MWFSGMRTARLGHPTHDPFMFVCYIILQLSLAAVVVVVDIVAVKSTATVAATTQQYEWQKRW